MQREQWLALLDAVAERDVQLDARRLVVRRAGQLRGIAEAPVVHSNDFFLTRDATTCVQAGPHLSLELSEAGSGLVRKLYAGRIDRDQCSSFRVSDSTACVQRRHLVTLRDPFSNLAFDLSLILNFITKTSAITSLV